MFLEEGAIDLLCLATDLEMDRCASIREIMTVTGNLASLLQYCHMDVKNKHLDFKVFYGIQKVQARLI